MKRKKLKVWRVEQDLTQEQLALSLGVTTGYVNQIELGKQDLNLKFLLKFKEIYKFKTLDEVVQLFEKESEVNV